MEINRGFSLIEILVSLVILMPLCLLMLAQQVRTHQLVNNVVKTFRDEINKSNANE